MRSKRIVPLMERWLRRLQWNEMREGECAQPGWNHRRHNGRRLYLWQGAQLRFGWQFSGLWDVEFKWFTPRACGCWQEGMGGGCWQHQEDRGHVGRNA